MKEREGEGGRDGRREKEKEGERERIFGHTVGREGAVID